MNARRRPAPGDLPRHHSHHQKPPGWPWSPAVHPELRHKVEGLKQLGNSVINSNPQHAVYVYTQALNICGNCEESGINLLNNYEICLLHSNRCVAFINCQDFPNAFKDAIACVKVDPSFAKGYYRVATVMKHLHREDEAMEALIDGYTKIIGSDQGSFSNRVLFASEITVLAVKLWDRWPKSQYLFRSFSASLSVWTQVVQKLAKKNSCVELRLLFLRGGTQSGKSYDVGHGGVATGCNTASIELKPLTRYVMSEHKEWGMHLLLALVKHGSKVEGLSQKEGDTPLHFAVENTLKTGWVDLLEYLFQRVYKTSAERNPTDRFGDSLFHVVAKTACPFQYTQVIVIILKKYRIDPTRTDRHGQKPLDVAVRAHSEVYSLLRATILEWERSTSNWQEQQQQQQQQQYRPPPQQQQRGQPRFPYNPGNQYPRPRFPTRPPSPEQPFFDPKKMFSSNQPHLNQPRLNQPRQPAPFFDAGRIFGDKKPPWQREQITETALEQRRRDMLRKQQEAAEEKRREEEERNRKRKEMFEEIERVRQVKLFEEEQERLEEERKRRQKMEDERQREVERKKKESARQQKIRQKQEEKKRKENLKRKEKRELRQKKEEESRLDAYKKGLKCQEQGKHDEAVDLFLEFIGLHHEHTFLYRDLNRCLKALLHSLEEVQEIRPTTKCAAPPTFWNETVKELAKEHKWWSLFMLFVGGSSSAHQNSKGVAFGCDASCVSILAFLLAWESLTKAPGRLPMVEALLQNKAKPNGLLDDHVTPLVYCLQNNNYSLVNLLLKYGAAPSQLVVDPGDTPLHAALKIGILQDDRKFSMLELLLTTYSSDETSVSYLDKNARDRSGNTLFHLALMKGTKTQSTSVVKLLSSHKVNPRLRNHGGKVPLDMIKNTDRRYMFLADAAKYYSDDKRDMMSKTGKTSDTASSEDYSEEWENYDGVKPHSRDGQHSSQQPAEHVPRKERLKQEVESLLYLMPAYVPKQPGLEEVTTRKPKTAMSPQRNGELGNPTIDDEDEVDDESWEVLDNEDEDEDEDEEIIINASIFDDLTWEVECTAKVWKFLRDKQVLHSLKETSIRKIQMLGNGNWRGRLCKPLEGLPKQHNMKLYEARLTRGSRILWELAIAFSPRCSDECDKRLASEDSSSEGMAVAGGRVYSEIIRIWDIVLDHDKVSHAIEVIVKSVERGEECIIRKNLIGMSNKVPTGGTTQQRLPTLFREITGSSPERKGRSFQDDTKKPPQPFFPPASSRENEYHIMKFYSVTSTLVNAVLNDSNVKVDFPFRVTELEHSIINLQMKPPSSLLLLGRSGTGKTTCCLYRMWTKFFKYWQRASEIGEPWLPRDIAFVHQDKTQEDADEDVSAEGDAKADDVRNETRGRLDAKTTCIEGAQSADDNADNNDEAVPTTMDHLHQIFITKNAVLCSEVQRNFCDMTHACECATEPQRLQDTPIPQRFQDAPQARYPLFLSSRQFMLLLDASLPRPYFPRAADGSMKRKIRGWGEEDGPLTFIPLLDDEDFENEEDPERTQEDDPSKEGTPDDDDDSDIHNIGAAAQGGRHDNQGGGDRRAKYDPRREVTYEVFAYEMWPKINKKKLSYHPTLIWMEIASFIKGSVEALHTDTGHLSLESYKDLGRKRAPNFTADREEIYLLFKKYEHEKNQKSYFDEGDLVFHLYSRLRDIKTMDWVIHEIYVDETQDFTQAELSLFIRCSHDPNALFLTGDTAQSIMRGVSFRFDDLKSLFHYASKSVKALGKHSAVSVPKRVYQLTHNYRSHAGILNLASSIVDLMTHFFPNSFDRLERDQGLFNGPSPVLLESCSFSDLAMLLCGNKRKTSEIEFGAHQVILVANEDAIEKLPAELQVGLVMTIFEAKGLEFDDVLLYNFFKDSPADKEWRVITEYLNDLIADHQNLTDEPSEALRTIDLDNLSSSSRPRPLKFNPDDHKVLNSELKYLYTAITRARVNVWIFDEDEVKRKPMFEYFRCLSLVKVIQPEIVNKAGVSELDAMFVEQSTNAEWIKRGDYFLKNKLWLVAAKCYQRANDEKKEFLARAHHQAIEAERLREVPHKMREEFLVSATLFLQCDSHKMAVNCLYNAKEFGLLAKLLEKLGEFSNAAKVYEKRLNRVSDACRCLELMGDYAKALDLLCSKGFHSKALDVVDRYKVLKQEHLKLGSTKPKHIKPPGATHSLDEMIYKSADYHHRQGNVGQMLDALDHLGQFEQRVDFLRKRGRFDEAVTMLEEAGRELEAAKMLKEQGKLEEACSILESLDYPEFVADCRLGQAKKLLLEPETDERNTAVINLLTKADELYLRCKVESVRRAETQLVLGHLKKDVGKVRGANLYFNKVSHTAGESACISFILELDPPKVFQVKSRLFTPLQNLLQLICALFECKTAEEERQRLRCQEFFGLVPGVDGQLHIQSCEGARIEAYIGKKLLSKTGDVDPVRAHEIIAKKCLIPRALDWVRWMRNILHVERKKLRQCQKYIIGMPCTKPRGMCVKLHEPYTHHKLLNLVKCLVYSIEIEDIMEKASRLSKFPSAEKLTTEIQQRDRSRFKLCNDLYEVFFPEHCHQRIIGDSFKSLAEFLNLVQSAVIKKQMKAFTEEERKRAKALDKRAGTDLYRMCLGVYQLIGGGTKVMDGWVVQEESDYVKWQNKGAKYSSMGMHPLNPRDRRGRHMSYKRRHLDSFDYLYSKRDAPESLKAFYGFFGTIAYKAVHPIMPSISNTVAMIEANVTMVLAIGAKCNHCAIAVPASYLSQATFFDALCCPRQGHVMYNAVNSVASFNRLPFYHVRALVDLICGSGKYGRYVNTLGDAFTYLHFIMSGEAERTLVLVLVMLCNAGLALPIQVAWDIRCALQAIAPSEHHPERVATALRSIQAAQSRRDALCVLEELLEAREKEYLRECVWSTSMPSRGAVGLDFKKINIQVFENVYFDSLPDEDPTVFVLEGKRVERGEDGSSEAALQEDLGMGLEVSVEEAAKVQRDQEKLQKDKASKIIVSFFRRRKLLLLASILRQHGWCKIKIVDAVQSGQEEKAKEWVSKQLIEFSALRVSPALCTICNVSLRRVAETKPELGAQAEMLDEREYDDLKDGRSTPEPREEISPEVDVDASADFPTKEEHEASLLHQETHSHFLKYGVMLTEEVYPLLAAVEGLLAELNFPSLQAGATEPTVVHTDLQYFEESLNRLITDLKNKMAELQKKRAFEQLQELQHGMALLTKVFSKAEKRYKKRTQESLRAAEENEGIIVTADDALEADIALEEEEAANEDKILPVAEQPRNTKGGRTKGKKKRSWQGRMGKKK
ncbi:TPR and ankyrin repeat-containing protein 1-like isoform X2 [Asterias rubens]|uniref:TPR and ankyrin repeat-containing protein 1-like isoform X2 n=1 Tax=Asterias rubens TaxID=7604 RepID=UPI001455751C|nr:TPR and ankyrin repeat-containing protein 1-like isoform X2 [Asterias rubens]